jgi:hypothetical protein
MRAFMVLLALCVAPFAVGAAQSPQGSNCDNGQGDEHRSAQGTAHAHHGQCLSQDPPPPPQPPPPPPPPPSTGSCAVTAPLSLGTASITGTVSDGSNWAGLAGWCVQVTGTASATGGAVSATVATDASGNYLVTGLPAGSYLVCEVLQSGWTETFPGSWSASCPGGTYGWAFSLADGQEGSFVNFTNVLATP